MGRLIYLLDTNTISEPVKNIPNQNVIEMLLDNPLSVVNGDTKPLSSEEIYS